MAGLREPTVYPKQNFNVTEDAETLRAAMKGLGTDEDTIIELLCGMSNAQRNQIASYFSQTLERDMIEDLKSELGGNFEDVIVALCMPVKSYLCKELNRAMDGAGTEEETLIEIVCSRTKKEIDEMIFMYESMYARPLAEHLCSETSGNLRRLLTMIVTGTRDGSNEVDAERAKAAAEELYASGEGTLGTEESAFYTILAKENFKQLGLIFEEYKNVSGNTIEQALNHELSGDYLEALLAVVECVQNPAAYFAKRLHKAVDGMGTDDSTLIRIIVSRSEIDLGTIKSEYERIYDKTLESAITGETSGDYKKIFLRLMAS